MISIGELLHGSDEDFVTNLYLAIMGRWPDEAGFAHHLAEIAGRPARRPEILEIFRAAEEAKLRRRPILSDPGPVPAARALAAQLALRTEVLRAEIGQLRETPGGDGSGAALLSEVAALGAAMNSLGTELRERIAALEAAFAGQIPSTPNLSPAVSVDYVSDLVEAAQAQLNLRLRAIEKRLAGLHASE